MKNIKTLFAKILGLQYEIDNLKFRKLIERYFIINDNYTPLQTITQIKVFKKQDIIILLIETHRPGLIIGKQGTVIDGMKQFIEQEINHSIIIELKESRMWIFK